MAQVAYSLEDPFSTPVTKEAAPRSPVSSSAVSAADLAGEGYHRMLADGRELRQLPKKGGGPRRVMVQHAKSRMTVWERIRVLADSEPNILWQNWGRNLDGASLVTGILNVRGRDVAVYGHDFTLRAGSMDATNGEKLARLLYLAGERGIPVIGMNDSAGAFVPAGVGGLDGYSEAFRALRQISGVVPSIMLMFGFNAGGGAYLPRQGSFMIQCDGTFIGLTGPTVVKEVLGERITAAELGGPQVHAASGVVDLTTHDELGSLRMAMRLLSYLPSNNAQGAPFRPTSDPVDRFTYEEEMLLRRTFSSPTM
ncbi:MAG: acetyl-CoA carboxylase carboxyltransferase subunit, partial [Deltaproteobacteria bacterium]|nr:acetyl-CoA carboxylase carboxyltransferase subunit [Deltaproteobacteria bacterium]